MTLQQLRYLAAIVECNLNISAAAQKLHTSQPGVSRQIRVLESELGFELFVREGRALKRLTQQGQRVVERAQRILRESQAIKGMSLDARAVDRGALSIATTHTQARYVLPSVIERFRMRYPKVKLHLHQGTSEQIADMIDSEHVDLAIATGSQDEFRHCLRLPLYEWLLTLEKLAQHPIVTYAFSLSGPSSISEAFARAGLEPDFALTARDSDVVKTYVRGGLGVGIIAAMAVDPTADGDLVSFEVAHLLPKHLTWIGFRRGNFLRRYAWDFIQSLGPHLDAPHALRAAQAGDQGEIDGIFMDTALPLHR
jgi:LysR family transcriptional regulator, cys regulon transcriptional activator